MKRTVSIPRQKIRASVHEDREHDEAAHDEGTLDLLRQANESLEDLHARYADRDRQTSARSTDLERALDQVSVQLAALRVGGAGVAAEQIASGLAYPDHRANMAEFSKLLRAAVKQPDVARAMSSDLNTDGGYVVSDQVEAAVDKLLRDFSPLRRLARNVSISGAAYIKHIWTSGAESGWVGERETRPETNTAHLSQIYIPANTMYAFPMVTEEVLADSRINLADEIAAEVGETFTLQEGSAFISGDAIKKPKGILAYDFSNAPDATRAWGMWQYVPTGAAGDFVTPTTDVSQIDVLVDLVHSLKVGYQANATWLMSQSTAKVLRKFKDREGRPVWEQSAQKGQPSMLLGFPVELDPFMPSIGAGTYPIAFGDWQRAYTVVNRSGTSVLVDPYSVKGYKGYYFTKRVGGGASNFAAAKFLKVAVS